MTNRRFAKFRIPALALGLVLAGGLTAAACKQGIGGVCQIKDDCEGDLECNAGTMRCQEPGGGSVPDAGAVDGQVIDAQVIDAAPAFDAAPPFDAAP
jgi:hypothetical protein